jgi:hypothetical protein
MTHWHDVAMTKGHRCQTQPQQVCICYQVYQVPKTC